MVLKYKLIRNSVIKTTFSAMCRKLRRTLSLIWTTVLSLLMYAFPCSGSPQENSLRTKLFSQYSKLALPWTHNNQPVMLYLDLRLQQLRELVSMLFKTFRQFVIGNSWNKINYISYTCVNVVGLQLTFLCQWVFVPWFLTYKKELFSNMEVLLYIMN